MPGLSRIPLDDALIGLAIAICVLPLAILMVGPWVGLPVTGGVALGSLIGAIALCCWVLRPKGPTG
jgi:hypothetical protein